MKTSTLEGANLDAAVALALGWKRSGDIYVGRIASDGTSSQGEVAQAPVHRWLPHEDARQAQPIIERLKIGIIPADAGGPGWIASAPGGKPLMSGATMLEAGMRAAVLALVGDEVPLP